MSPIIPAAVLSFDAVSSFSKKSDLTDGVRPLESFSVTLTFDPNITSVNTILSLSFNWTVKLVP